MEISITILFKNDKTDLDKELFGLGDIVTDPEILKYIPKSNEPLRYVNQTCTIIDGVTLYHPKIKRRITESLETGIVDYHFILSVAEILGLGKLSYEITDWFLKKTKDLNCIIKIGDKEVKTREEFQMTLDEYEIYTR